MVLSYTTINDYHISPHSFLNKAMGVEKEETDAMRAGKEAHDIIQAHCLGKNPDERLKNLTWNFNGSEWHCRRVWDEKTTLHGYIDLVNYKSKMIGEIKTSTSPWGQKQFDTLIQWKYYALITGFRKVLFITCKPDLSGVKVFYAEAQAKDMMEAKTWVQKAVDGINAGKFTGDLVDGKCTNPRCPYGERCWYL